MKLMDHFKLSDKWFPHSNQHQVQIDHKWKRHIMVDTPSHSNRPASSGTTNMHRCLWYLAKKLIFSIISVNHVLIINKKVKTNRWGEGLKGATVGGHLQWLQVLGRGLTFLSFLQSPENLIWCCWILNKRDLNMIIWQNKKIVYLLSML